MIEDSPSLRRHAEQTLAKAFVSGRLKAARETGIDFTLFPRASPFTIDEVLDPDFLPSHTDPDDPTP